MKKELLNSYGHSSKHPGTSSLSASQSGLPPICRSANAGQVTLSNDTAGQVQDTTRYIPEINSSKAVYFTQVASNTTQRTPVNFHGYYPNYSHDGLKDAQLKSRSRNNAGTIELQSTDPRDMPLINFHSFDTGMTTNDAGEKDLQAVYEAMQFSRTTFEDLIPLYGGFDEVWPGPNVNTEAQIKDFIKKEAWGHHACCTAAIGGDTDPLAVLDADFRGRGVDGLRVVDASVSPKIPGCCIALPIYMISEKAAEVIIADAS